MAKFRIPVKGSSRATKPIGGSSSSNPKTTKHRNAAKAQRLANICPLIPVDEKMEMTLLKQLPLKEMSLEGKRRDPKIKKVKRKAEKQTNPELLEKIKEETSVDDKQKLLKKEDKLWQILPSHLSSSAPDYQTTMPILAPILGAALNERPDLRLTALGSIRAALQMDTKLGFNIMERFAKNLLPILFSLYTRDGDEEEKEETSRKHDPKAVHLSALETIRAFMRHTPKALLKHYISAALEKLVIEEKGQSFEKKLLLADLLTTMCISAEAEDLLLVSDRLQSWFVATGRAQKKAYRLFAQIYQRISEPQLAPFFDSNRHFLTSLISSGLEKVDKSAFQWRIAIFRNVIASFTKFTDLSQFSDKIYGELLTFLAPSNSTPTRHQATNCLLEMAKQLLKHWTTEGMTSSEPLHALFARLFEAVKSPVKPDNEEQMQCALIALNILATKQLRQANANLVSELVDSTAAALQATDPKHRVLAIRLMRTICAKIQPFMFEQYKDLILEAIFSQPTKEATVRIRKSNVLLLNLLLERLGAEELLKFTEDIVWIKMLKNLAKMRRRRERKNGTDQQQALPARRGMSKSGASTVLSTTNASAISSLISLGAKTAHVDSIFDILEDSSDEEAADDGEVRARQRRKSSRQSSRLSVVIEEGAEDDDPLDLLNHKALESKLTLMKRKEKKRKFGKEEEEGAELDGPFRRNKEGKLLITNLDEKSSTKKKKRKVIEQEEEKEGDEEEEEEDAKEDSGGEEEE